MPRVSPCQFPSHVNEMEGWLKTVPWVTHGVFHTLKSIAAQPLISCVFVALAVGIPGTSSVLFSN